MSDPSAGGDDFAYFAQSGPGLLCLWLARPTPHRIGQGPSQLSFRHRRGVPPDRRGLPRGCTEALHGDHLARRAGYNPRLRGRGVTATRQLPKLDSAGSNPVDRSNE